MVKGTKICSVPKTLNLCCELFARKKKTRIKKKYFTWLTLEHICVNTFKHNIKKSFFDDLQKQNDDIFFYY